VKVSDPPPHRPPNIVLIITDDAGYGDFGFTGVADLKTPHIDALARRGVVCSQGYVTASVCSPSRAGLITGRYQQRFGYEMNIVSGMDNLDALGLDVGEKTIADELSSAGYTTGAFGKWHLGSSDDHHPLSRGFDSFYGYLGGSRSYTAIKRERQWYSAMRDRAFEPESEGYYVTTALGDDAVDFIDRNAEDPFLLYLSFTAVHTPMHARESDLARFPEIEDKRRQKLAAMTWALDEAVGSVMAAIDRHELDEDTLIFFVNDNGGATNNASDNGIYRGMKGSKWEGGLRVPYVVAWAGQLPAGTTYDRPVSTLDILPTAIAAARLPLPAHLDGVDLLPFLTGTTAADPHDVLYWNRSPVSAIRVGDWKLIEVDDGRVILTNVQEDPGETIDHAAAEPERVASMRGMLAAWKAQMPPRAWDRVNESFAQNQRKKHDMSVVGREAERHLP
jgi:arylsulfatase A-like enzyme